MLMLSMTPVARVPSMWLVTTSPTSTVEPSATVSVLTTVHVIPSGDCEAVTVVPLRASLSHVGATIPDVVVDAVVPFVVLRRSNARPLLGFTTTAA